MIGMHCWHVLAVATQFIFWDNKSADVLQALALAPTMDNITLVEHLTY